MEKDWNNLNDDDMFALDLIVALGMEAEPDEEKAAFLGEVTKTLQKALFLRIHQSLDETKKQEFSQALETGDITTMNSFLEANVPNYEDLVREETVKLKRALLTGNMPT